MLTVEYPFYFVARIFDLDIPTEHVMVKCTLQELRDNIPPRFHRNVNVNDRLPIIETWF